jgi:phosphoserine phosphatase
MQHDLEVARQIQQGLLPKRNPKLAGYDIAGWNRSADETGGDCYDFMPLPDGKLAVFLADATGHGIGAALVIAQARSLLRAMLSVTQDLKAIVTGVNDLISKDLADDRFVTAFIGVIDPQAHTVEYISNGQGPLVMVSAAGVDSRGANSFPLAVMPDFCFEKTDSFELSPGATLVLLTDGFYETTNPASEQFGEARVVEFVQRCAGKPAVELISGLYDEIRRFASGEKQADDLTAVVIHRTN